MSDFNITLVFIGGFIFGIIFKWISDSMNPKIKYYYKISWLDKQTGKPEVRYVVLKKEMTVSTYKKIISKINEFPNLRSGGIIETIRVEDSTDYKLYNETW